jgi:hypothetical protein
MKKNIGRRRAAISSHIYAVNTLLPQKLREGHLVWDKSQNTWVYRDTSGSIQSLGGGDLPDGRSGQTPRHDGRGWVANDKIIDDGSGIMLGTSSVFYQLAYSKNSISLKSSGTQSDASLGIDPSHLNIEAKDVSSGYQKSDFNVTPNYIELDTDTVLMPKLPTTDPHIANALWSDAGTLKVSAG